MSGDDGDVLHGYWQKLSAGGNTTMPMQKQPWGDEFGIVVGQFGISWLVNISSRRHSTSRNCRLLQANGPGPLPRRALRRAARCHGRH